MKKLSKILVIVLCLSLLAGCSGSNSSKNQTKGDAEVQKSAGGELSYVLIYNPNIYDETKSRNQKLNTGEFDKYVEAIVDRADGLEGELPEILPYSSPENFIPFTDEVDLSGNRGDTMITPYEVDDVKEFYCGTDTREIEEFVCKYAGEYCNVWEFDSGVKSSNLELVGKEFDDNIFETMTTAFGKGRFVDNGAKVNILIYDFKSTSLLGFCSGLDIYSKNEVTSSLIKRNSLNTDHAIIHINSAIVNKRNIDIAYSTLAHEYQHQIAFSSYFNTVNGTMMHTWLNEAMSGYIEELIYPGTKESEGHFESFATSDLIRHGQSLYNFDTLMTKSDFDIGVYGSVYLFTEYLANAAGDEVFSKIHDYWNNSYSDTLSEAEAIVNSVPNAFYDTIDSSIEFDSDIDFDNDDEEWLSKLTLDFYLSMLSYDKKDPDAFKNIESQTLLYDEINPADIEGGGRVIVALKNDKFEIPRDSDNGLIYVGLNENFEVMGILND